MQRKPGATPPRGTKVQTPLTSFFKKIPPVTLVPSDKANADEPEDIVIVPSGAGNTPTNRLKNGGKKLNGGTAGNSSQENGTTNGSPQINNGNGRVLPAKDVVPSSPTPTDGSKNAGKNMNNSAAGKVSQKNCANGSPKTNGNGASSLYKKVVSTPSSAKMKTPQTNEKKRGRVRPMESSEESGDDPDKDPDFAEIEADLESDSDSVISDGELEEESSVESEPDSGEFKTPKKRKLGSKDQTGGKKKKATERIPTSGTRHTPSNARTPAGRARKNIPKSTPQSAHRTSANKKANSSVTEDFLEDEDGDASNDGEFVARHTHEKIPWLEPDKIRDKDGMFHKDLIAQGITPRTLKVPSDFLNDKKSCSPALRQWWIMKSDNYDCVLFFKLGKFYELYHMDADVGVKELNLIYMRGDHAHCGFPEGGLSWKQQQLVQKGYKVMRVEQTMTAQQKKDQNDKSMKTMPRENVRIYTPGTQSVTTLECESQTKDEKRTDFEKTCDANREKMREQSCLLVIAEKVRTSHEGAEEYEYGIAVLYPGPGTFLVGQFKEDRYHSRFRTLLARHPPNEIILERGRVSASLSQLLRANTETACRDFLSPGKEFLESENAITLLLEKEYFGSIMDPKWPDVLAKMLTLGGTLPTAKSEFDLAIRAFGTCAWYLGRLQIDYELISLKNIDQYLPVDLLNSSIKIGQPKHMVLDGVTLANLDIIPTSSNADSCLLKKANRCKTKFGSRLLKEWIVAPLFRIPDIVERQQAVKDIADFRKNHDSLYKSAVTSMKGFPDLERLLAKVHIIGSLKRNKDHPESRAVMFDDKVYGKKKIKDFSATITGFKKIVKMVQDISGCFDVKSSGLVKHITTLVERDGMFPNLKPVLEQFANCYDQKQAEEEGRIIPKAGVDETYDGAGRAVQDVLDKLELYRMNQSRKLNCRVDYHHQARNRFQMEIPASVSKVPNDYERKSERKGFVRYWTTEITSLLDLLVPAEEKREAAAKDCTRRVFEKFDNHYAEWIKAVKCVAILDVLFCLEDYSSNLVQSCVPIFKESSASQSSYISIRDGTHPLVVTTASGGAFIPNDTYIGVGEPEDPSNGGAVVLVTGPNMGGKSTLMRQIGLIAVLAQLGSSVPASFCEMTPIDRIFTRIGASDNLLAGESTFFVELSETSSILQHATSDSLVLIDELGRGTATFDGTAIAAAVLKDLATRIKCRTLFSTHYHTLVERFSGHSGIKLGHLACLVENQDDNDPTQETITFLYKFLRGDCPKSYGFNAARLAGLSDKIVRRAHEQAVAMEKLMELGKMKLRA